MNFVEINGKYVGIKHHSTSSLIEMTIKGSIDEHGTQTAWFDYSEFDSLVDVIRSLEDYSSTKNGCDPNP